MYLSKTNRIHHELLELQQSFFSIRIQISTKRLTKLLTYQYSICKVLDWVELDTHKLTQIITFFLESNLIYEWNYMMILKTIIQTYYELRVLFDYHTTDSDILDALYLHFLSSSDAHLEKLKRQVERDLLKKGGSYRNA